MSGEIVDLLPGKPVFVWVSGPTTGQAVFDCRGREVLLVRNGPVITAELHDDTGNGFGWPVTGRGRDDSDALHRLTEPSSGMVAVVSAEETAQRNRRWLRLRVHEYAAVRQWSQPLVVGLDDRILDAVRRLCGKEESNKQGGPVGWLRRHIRLEYGAGRESAVSQQVPRFRFTAVAAPGQELVGPEPCMLLGDGIAVSLAQGDDGWYVTGVRKHSRQPGDGQRLVLVHGDIDFVDRSTRARLRAQMKSELNRVRTNQAGETFLARWREYHDLENRHALSRMRALEYLAYTGWERRDGSGHVLRFRLDADNRDSERQQRVLTHLAAALAAGEEVELECAQYLPDVLGGSRGVDLPPDGLGLLDLQAAQGNEVGTVQSVDVDAATVDLRLTTRNKTVDGVGPSLLRRMPHRSGWLHAAIGGDRRRLQRRAHALDRVMRGRIALPQLLSLLQGQPARGQERQRPIDAYSEAAWACFKGEPTESQKLALRAALNTPDIAVIQGPPGTGKTQLIAALQQRLAEEARGYAVVSRNMLLTSYQHAAVDNLVERSKVWDLPAIKVDSQDRGSTAHISAWLSETIGALERELAGEASGRRTLALREVVRQAAAYAMTPVAAEAVPALLENIAERVHGLISDSVLRKLDDLRAEVEIARRVAALHVDPQRDSTLRAVRGLRCTPVAFADDGPLMAEAALARLRRIDSLNEQDRDLVRRAADWQDEGTPPFLADLAVARDRLLDQLLPVQRLAVPAVRQDVLDLLAQIADDLQTRLGASPEGVEQVLADYLDDLRGDPGAVRHTLRLYTTSLAATCQQADSRLVAEAKGADEGEVLFDTVIVDEAARANPLDLLIPLAKAAHRIVLVGDHKQLPHMLEPDVEQGLEEQGRTSELAVLRRSVFEQLFTLLRQDATSPKRAVRLSAQFRMHQALGDFISRNFYDGTLESPRPDADFVHGLDRYDGKPAAWLRVPHAEGGEVPGMSKARTIEAWRIAEELRRTALDRPDLTFGVITFYAAQVQAIWRALEQVGLAVLSGNQYRPVDALLRDHRGEERQRLQVGTVDAFQGKEFDIAFLSVTRSRRIPAEMRSLRAPQANGHDRYRKWVRETYGHLVLRNRMCVAMSRQQRLLVVVGNDALFAPDVAPPEVAALTDFRRLCRSGIHGTMVPSAGASVPAQPVPSPGAAAPAGPTAPPIPRPGPSRPRPPGQGSPRPGGRQAP